MDIIACINIGNTSTRMCLLDIERREVLASYSTKEKKIKGLPWKCNTCVVVSVRKDVELDAGVNVRIFRVGEAISSGLVKVPYSGVGEDRVAGVWGVFFLYPGVMDFMTISVGTAITYNIVREGEFKGGAISPGIYLRAKSLFTGTSALPFVDCSDQIKFPATNVMDAINAGVILGIAGEIRYMMEISDIRRAFICGGGVTLLRNFLPEEAIVVPYLEEWGAVFIAQKMAGEV